MLRHTSRRYKRLEAQKAILNHFEEKIPYFTDIFDERTFYITFACLTIALIILAIVLSVYCNVSIEEADEIERKRMERRHQKEQRLAEKMKKKRQEKYGNIQTDNASYNNDSPIYESNESFNTSDRNSLLTVNRVCRNSTLNEFNQIGLIE
jgi:hypothetical protein